MKIVNYRDNVFQISKLNDFFRENDSLFVDPFSNHIDTDVYMDKLINNGEVLVAHDNEQIAGIACAYMNDKEERIAHFQLLLVKENYQGLGIGRKLCLEIIKLAKEKGMKEIILIVDKSNIKAQSLYESIGYTDTDSVHENEEKKYMICKLEEVV